MQRALAHVIRIDLHTVSVAAHAHEGQLIAVAAIVEIDAIPLSAHDVEVNLSHHMVEAVAAQGDGLLLGATGGERAFD